MNIQELFNKTISGDISKEKFLYEVRRDVRLNKLITNTMGFNDCVNVLKNKSIISEKFEDNSEKFDFLGTIKSLTESAKSPKKSPTDSDYVHHGEFTKGWKIELEKTDDIDKAKAKAIKNLEKDPMYYTRQEMEDFVKTKKKRTDLPIEVKKGNFVDKDNGVKKVKGIENPKKDPVKKDPKASRKPVGVKLMKESLKKKIDLKEAKFTENKYKFFVIKSFSNKMKIVDGFNDRKLATDYLHDNPMKGYVIKSREEVSKLGLDPDKVSSWNNPHIKESVNEIVGTESEWSYIISMLLSAGAGATYLAAMVQPAFKRLKDEEKLKVTDKILDKAKVDPNKKKSLLDKIKSKLGLKEDNLPGGKGDKIDPKSVDKEELKKGIKHEKEHTSDVKIAMEIALDHLAEDPKYYTNLSKAGIDESANSSKWEGNGKYTVIIKSTTGDNKSRIVDINSKNQFDQISSNKTILSISKQKNTPSSTGDELYMWKREGDNNWSWGELTKSEFEKYSKDPKIEIKKTTQDEIDKKNATKADVKPSYSSAAKGATQAVIVKKGPGANSDTKFMTSNEIEKWKSKHGEDSIEFKKSTSPTTKTVGNDKPVNFDNFSFVIIDPQEQKIIKAYKSGDRSKADEDIKQYQSKGFKLLPVKHPDVRKILMSLKEISFKADPTKKFKGLELSFTCNKKGETTRISNMYLKKVKSGPKGVQKGKFDFQIDLVEKDSTTGSSTDKGNVILSKSPQGDIKAIYNEAGNFYKILDFDKDFDELIKVLYAKDDKSEDLKEIFKEAVIKRLKEYSDTHVKAGPAVKLKELERVLASFTPEDLNGKDPYKKEIEQERLTAIKSIVSDIKMHSGELTDVEKKKYVELLSKLKGHLDEDNNHVQDVKMMQDMSPEDLSDFVIANTFPTSSIKNKAAAQLLAPHLKQDPTNEKIKKAFLKVTGKSK